MRKKVLILVCALLLGISIAVWQLPEKKEEPERTVAWWSLLYEKPNPDQLPVQVRFKWIKNLD